MFLDTNQINKLQQFLESLKIDDIQDKIEKFDTYAKNLYRWNEKINLTRVKKEDVVDRHFLDSIEVLKEDIFKDNDVVLDMGTGGGFPGIPLKICNPRLQITLLDASQKKIDFVNYIVHTLNLENAFPIHSRIEDFQKISLNKFSVVTARALTQINQLIKFATPFLNGNGKMVFLKSKEEIIDAKNILGSDFQYDTYEHFIVIYR